MRPDTFTLALRAAARVACAAALVGCVPKTGQPDDSVSATDDSQAATDDSQAATDDSQAATDDSSTPLAECLDVVDAVFGEGGSGSPDAQTAACCQEIAEYWDSVDLAGMESWTTRDACCELLEWQGSLACTPWGPPCPPAMPGPEAVA